MHGKIGPNSLLKAELSAYSKIATVARVMGR